MLYLFVQVMQKNKIQHQDYDSLVMRVVRREPLTDDTSVTCYRRTKVSMKPETTEDASDSSVKKHNVHSLNLQVVRDHGTCLKGDKPELSAWHVFDPWTDWFHCFPNNIAIYRVATYFVCVHQPTHRFPASFVV